MDEPITISEEKVKGDFKDFTPFVLHIEKIGMVSGVYQHKENTICVSHAMCPGMLKCFINIL